MEGPKSWDVCCGTLQPLAPQAEALDLWDSSQLWGTGPGLEFWGTCVSASPAHLSVVLSPSEVAVQLRFRSFSKGIVLYLAINSVC